MYAYFDSQKRHQDQLLNAAVEAFLAQGGTIKQLDRQDGIIVNHKQVINRSPEHLRELKNVLIRDLIELGTEKGYLTHGMVSNMIKERGLTHLSVAMFCTAQIIKDVSSVKPLRKMYKPQRYVFEKK